MSDGNVVTIPLSAGQIAQFKSFSQQEEDAKRVPIARQAAAMAIALGQYAPEQINGQPIEIDADRGTISIVLKG